MRHLSIVVVLSLVASAIPVRAEASESIVRKVGTRVTEPHGSWLSDETRDPGGWSGSVANYEGEAWQSSDVVDFTATSFSGAFSATGGARATVGFPTTNYSRLTSTFVVEDGETFHYQFAGTLEAVGEFCNSSRFRLLQYEPEARVVLEANAGADYQIDRTVVEVAGTLGPGTYQIQVNSGAGSYYGCKTGDQESAFRIVGRLASAPITVDDKLEGLIDHLDSSSGGIHPVADMVNPNAGGNLLDTLQLKAMLALQFYADGKPCEALNQLRNLLDKTDGLKQDWVVGPAATTLQILVEDAMGTISAEDPDVDGAPTGCECDQHTDPYVASTSPPICPS